LENNFQFYGQVLSEVHTTFKTDALSVLMALEDNRNKQPDRLIQALISVKKNTEIVVLRWIYIVYLPTGTSQEMEKQAS
jgi:hypothetical protein